MIMFEKLYLSFSRIIIRISRNKVRFYDPIKLTHFRSKHYCLLVLLVYSIFSSSCGLDVEDAVPPLPPEWVEKSFPEEWPERGIDAHESGGIYLEWKSNESKDKINFHIYRAEWYAMQDSLSEFVKIAKLEQEWANGFEYVDRRAIVGIKYYYKLKAEDNAENLSDFSDSISYLLLPSLEIGDMIPNGLSDSLCVGESLSWDYSYSIEMENYCLTIVSDKFELMIRTVFPPGNYLGSREYWQMPSNTLFHIDQIYRWRIETGANYSMGREAAGSESAWATFLYTGG